MNYKITVHSAWEQTRIIFVESEEEKDELVGDFKNNQYKVEVEEIEG
jgi:hypothetical protein